MVKGKARDLDLEASWRKRITRQEQSGTTVREFCREVGLKESVFHYWKRELRRRNGEPQSSVRSKQSSQVHSSHTSPTLLPVTITADSHQQSPVEILLPSGTRLRVSDNCAAATLQMVIGVLDNS